MFKRSISLKVSVYARKRERDGAQLGDGGRMLRMVPGVDLKHRPLGL
jgi:hypothetical protein